MAEETRAKVPTNSQFSAGERCDPPACATLSPVIASLFPEGVAAAELRAPGNVGTLEPAEAGAIVRAVPKRAQEFAAGRLCARRVLAEFGIVDFAVLMAADRRPLWPEPLIGSITHTAGFCAAAAAQRSSFESIGIDTEASGAVKPELWARVCVDSELAWVGSLPAARRAQAVTLIFSAKEAFYKCQYPVTGERLSFTDVEVAAFDWGGSRGSLSLSPTRTIVLGDRSARLECAFRFHEDFVSTGACLPAPQPAPPAVA